MSVQQTTEGLGLIGWVLCIMAVFGVLSLAVIFSYHSALTGVYAISERTHVPFLVLLAWPIWLGLIGAVVEGAYKLLKYITRA